MSVHSSLRSGKSKGHKSVLNRLEKVIRLKKEDKWLEEDSVFGLPKVKMLKLRIKKEKAKAPEEAIAGTAAEGAAVPAGGVAAKSTDEKKPGGDKKK